MSDLSSWWTTGNGPTKLLVAKNAADAAKRAGVTPGSFPFLYRMRLGPLPYGVDKPGLYRNVGGAWVREQLAKGPPDLEEP